MTKEQIIAAIDHEAATPDSAKPCSAVLHTYAQGSPACTRGEHSSSLIAPSLEDLRYVHVATDDTGSILAVWAD